MQAVCPADLEDLRAQVRTLEQTDRKSVGVLPFEVAALDAVLPGGGLALGALHEVAGGGDDAVGGAAAALFAAGIVARLPGQVLLVHHPTGPVRPRTQPRRAQSRSGHLCRGRGREVFDGLFRRGSATWRTGRCRLRDVASDHDRLPDAFSSPPRRRGSSVWRSADGDERPRRPTSASRLPPPHGGVSAPSRRLPCLFPALAGRAGGSNSCAAAAPTRRISFWTLAMRRVVSLFLPNWSVDRLRRRLGAGAPPLDQPLILTGRMGRKRVVTACNAAAAVFGARVGMAATQAQTLIPGLDVRAADPNDDTDALDRLALWAMHRYAADVSG